MIIINKQLDHFLKEGKVASFREFPYKIHKEILINNKYKGKITKIINNPNFGQINEHQKISGFENSKEWIQETKKINEGNKPKFLVIIEKLEKNI